MGFNLGRVLFLDRLTARRAGFEADGDALHDGVAFTLILAGALRARYRVRRDGFLLWGAGCAGVFLYGHVCPALTVSEFNFHATAQAVNALTDAGECAQPVECLLLAASTIATRFTFRGRRSTTRAVRLAHFRRNADRDSAIVFFVIARVPDGKRRTTPLTGYRKTTIYIGSIFYLTKTGLIIN
ncbi:hypothetical protein LG202_08670 [Methylobacillus methanolivorans]